MMGPLLNAMRAQAMLATSGRAIKRIGIVTSYDPGAYAAKAMVQPENTGETGWLPIMSVWVGNGWGLFVPPSIGDAVEVEFLEDNAEVGLIGLRSFNDVDRPLPVPAGEFWLVHQSGAFFKLTNDGKIGLNSGAEIDAGNLANTVHKLVTDAFVTLFNGHTHPDAQGGTTGVTSTPMSDAHLTAILKAN